MMTKSSIFWVEYPFNMKVKMKVSLKKQSVKNKSKDLCEYQTKIYVVVIHF